MSSRGFVPLQATPATLSSQLYANETQLLSQSDVGLYKGKTRDAAHDHGSLYLTSHRLIYLDATRPEFSSLALDLASIRQTEYWAGFLKSSAKISLVLGDEPQEEGSQVLGETQVQAASSRSTATGSWVCRVCGMSNASLPQCSLCGMPRSASAAASPSPSPAPASSTSHLPSPVADSDDNRVSCPACTYLNHPSLLSCELCDSPLGQGSLAATPSPVPSTSATPAQAGLQDYVKLSFRKGGDKAFYAALKKALQAKAWQTTPPPSDPDRFALAGIDGILRTIDTAAVERDTSMQSALSDLTTLMDQAKSMVDMAQSLNNKLQSRNSEEATTIKSSLQAMGLEVAVTSDMAASSRDYARQLAGELAQVLERRQILDQRGMVGLDEVWCVWNRARGVSLVSPKEFREALQYLPSTAQFKLFSSGLGVLHAPRFSREAFTGRLLQRLAEEESISTLQVAQSEEIGMMLASEMCEEVEQQGSICRDEQGDGGTRWWPNVFLEQ